MSKEIKDITYELIKAIEEALYSKEVQKRKEESLKERPVSLKRK